MPAEVVSSPAGTEPKQMTHHGISSVNNGQNLGYNDKYLRNYVHHI